MEPNLIHLRYLNAAIKAKSFSQAARELSVTPQAVAKAVRLLEQDFAAPLFESVGNRVEPTEFALGIARHLDDTLRHFDDFLHYAHAVRSTRHAQGSIALGIATSPNRCRVFAHGDFARYCSQNPFCHLNVQLLTNELCSSSLREGLLDAAVVYGTIDKPDIECRIVGTLRLHAVMSRAHPLAQKEKLSLRDLHRFLVATPLDENFTSPQLTRECLRLNVRPRFFNLEPSRKATRLFIAQGGIVLLATCNDCGEQPFESVRIPLHDTGGFSVPLYFACRRRDARRLESLYAYVVGLKDAKPEAFDRYMPLKNSSAETPRPSRIFPSDFMRMSS